MRYAWIWMLITACGPDTTKVDRSDDTGALPGDGSGENAPFNLAVTWGDSSIDLVISGGADGRWWFGIAETGEGDGWYGEDCIGGDNTYSYCHPASTTGLSLTYGAAPESVQEGVNTVFPDKYFAEWVTYYVENTNTGECWVWGDNTIYYKDQDCTTWSPAEEE